MATYLILNSIFICIVCLTLKISRRSITKPLLLTFLVLLILTAVFDNLIILASIVNYDPSKILGIYIGKAPIEDFMYSLLAVLLLPALWNILGKRSAR